MPGPFQWKITNNPVLLFKKLAEYAIMTRVEVGRLEFYGFREKKWKFF